MTCKLMLGLAGVLIGAFSGGVGGVLVTLVFPHGGWEHVSPDERIRLASWTIGGAAIGVGAGALFDTGLRKQSAKHFRGGVLFGLGAFWGFISSFVLVHQAPLWLHGLNAAPYFLLAAFVMAQKSAGRELWLAVIPTLAFSVWLNFYAYLFWLRDSVRHFSLYSRLSADERHHGGMIESGAWFVLLWPFIGVGVALVSAALCTFLQRRSGHSSGVFGGQRT